MTPGRVMMSTNQRDEELEEKTELEFPLRSLLDVAARIELGELRQRTLYGRRPGHDLGEDATVALIRALGRDLDMYTGPALTFRSRKALADLVVRLVAVLTYDGVQRGMDLTNMRCTN